MSDRSRAGTHLLIFCVGMLNAATVFAGNQTDVEVKAYWRFEDTIPSAYWRYENVYTDHSGHQNHLGFAEPTEGNVAYDNVIDGNPQSHLCTSNVGLGCTYLEYTPSFTQGGYFQDKRQRSDWKAYDGQYSLSADVPPQSMFNLPNARKSYVYTQRTDLYTVEDKVLPSGAGMASFHPGNMSDTEKAVLFF
jgi:hypothetical protein